MAGIPNGGQHRMVLRIAGIRYVGKSFVTRFGAPTFLSAAVTVAGGGVVGTGGGPPLGAVETVGTANSAANSGNEASGFHSPPSAPWTSDWPFSRFSRTHC